jgi:hypothetical protein
MLSSLKSLAIFSGLATTHALATGGATGVDGFALANSQDPHSPTRIVLDTLGTMETDATSGLASNPTYQSLSQLCNTTVADLRQQVNNDATLFRDKHQVLTFDIARITKAAQHVDQLENKLTTSKISVSRSNRTLYDLNRIREIQTSFFTGHSTFLNEVKTDLVRLHEFLDAKPSHLSKHLAPHPDLSTWDRAGGAAAPDEAAAEDASAPDAGTDSAQQLIELTSTLQQRQHQYQQRTRRLRHVQQALLVSSSASPPHSVHVNEITDVTPAPPSFHTSFHTSLDELHSFLSNATSEHATSEEQSNEEYNQAYTALSTESSLQHGKMVQLKNQLAQARAEHQSAVTVMDKIKDSALDKSKDFETKNKKAALSALERQCALMHQSQDLRMKHYHQDLALSKQTKRLMMEIVDEMNGATGGAAGGATGGESATGGATGSMF